MFAYQIPGISFVRDEKKDEEIPNYDKQNNPFCGLKFYTVSAKIPADFSLRLDLHVFVHITLGANMISSPVTPHSLPDLTTH